MSYNKNYGGQFMGLRQGGTNKGSHYSNNDNKSDKIKLNEHKSADKKEKIPATKVILYLSELRGISLPEIENGEIFFFCTAIFDNQDVKMSMEKSNYNSPLVKGDYLSNSYALDFESEIVLKIPEDATFVRCYVSYVSSIEADGKRNIKLEGIGYTDPFIVKECHVYPYSRCKLNTAAGAQELGGALKICVKCVDNTHPSTVKATEPCNVIEEFKKRYED
ncbi:conserved protein, unknown function [Plasmodium yoelii]|nr:conserved protein, unknown function [Plasmodium yoelii]CDU18103.1 conserved Plasmodium protein, unknown function [Plasmodium yoelii]VTZ78520.1 conserved protein, unknown function [Plasmodium yoelii]|eukprot:XP_022812238.1 conserved protein, unknown function [Plasmodium yoelii]